MQRQEWCPGFLSQCRCYNAVDHYYCFASILDHGSTDVCDHSIPLASPSRRREYSLAPSDGDKTRPWVNSGVVFTEADFDVYSTEEHRLDYRQTSCGSIDSLLDSSLSWGNKCFQLHEEYRGDFRIYYTQCPTVSMSYIQPWRNCSSRDNFSLLNTYAFQTVLQKPHGLPEIKSEWNMP